jgi:dTDP-L-rhamnose 4-epimerase
MKVLVTGGGGFIGRHVSEELLRKGHRVLVLDALVEQVHGVRPAEPPEGVGFVKGDIRDPHCVAKAVRGVDAIIHLAAEVGVGQSMYEIARYVGANELGTAVLLDALIKSPVRRVVVASSMSVYGEGRYVTEDGQPVESVRRTRRRMQHHQWDPVSEQGAKLRPVATDENKPVNLASIYALTKYAQERAVLIFGEAYGVDAVALRLFNVFGPGQALSNPYTGVLANFSSRLANGQRPMVFEDGEQKRDFVHVKDVARAFRLALEKPGIGGHVINVGSGHAYSIKEVATLLAEAMGVPELGPEFLAKARAGDIRHCFADISKARELLGYDARHCLEGSIHELVEWVRGSIAVDRGAVMKQQLEAMGLVS